jgi:hypothetical protein
VITGGRSRAWATLIANCARKSSLGVQFALFIHTQLTIMTGQAPEIE